MPNVLILNKAAIPEFGGCGFCLSYAETDKNCRLQLAPPRLSSTRYFLSFDANKKQ